MTTLFSMMYLKIFLMFLSVALPIAIIIIARLIRPLKIRTRYKVLWSILITLVVLFAAAALPLTIRMAQFPAFFTDYHLETVLPWLYYTITFICILIVLIIFSDIVLFAVKCIKWIRERKNTNAEEPDPSAISRRAFLGKIRSASIAGGALVLTPPAIYYAKSRRVIKNIDIHLSAIPEALDGFRIAHLSDIHVGNTITRDDIAGIVAETNALDADMIVITGDMADGMPEIIGDWLEPMRNFKARYGVFFVTGNHDHMWDGAGWCKVIASLGIHVLDNAHEFIDVNGTRFAVAGAIDIRGDRRKRSWLSDPAKALSGIPADMFKLMLVHQPSSVNTCFKYGADLVLLGHTHGGQFWPLSHLIDALHRYARGLYMVDGRAAFVSCGTGYWGPPLRFGVPPEIDVICLHPKENV